MTRNRKDQSCAEGRLPALTPLANPFVPFQEENPPKYEAGKGIVRGTMFPGLDLPFKGMVNQRELNRAPLSDLQALYFAVQDLALYLDTHREDCEALELYRNYQRAYEKCRMEYQKKHGPMTHTEASASGCYDWLDDPWPWEYCRNKEV